MRFRYNRPRSFPFIVCTAMGNRLSKIVTRTGDGGSTGLGDGSRVAKDCQRIETIGEIDELNSCLGVLLAEPCPDDVRAALLGVQNDLFDLGGEICIPGTRLIGEAHVSRVEDWVERFNADLAPLKDFILPGGTRAAALAHLARTVCRRVERRLVSLARDEAVSEEARKYLNRLSDLLFVLGRRLNHTAGQPDVLWASAASRAGTA